MRKLPRPTESAEDIYKICISKVRNVDLKNRLENCENNINLASEEFEAKATSTCLHEIVQFDYMDENISSDEMIKVYTNRMVKKDSPGRFFYDQLKSMPLHGKCPLCGHRIVSTIDHHLPKAYYPIYSVNPINLIPACFECNKIKDTCSPSSSDEEMLHPYFDDVESETWLKARVIETSPCVIEFFVEKPEGWNDTIGNRIKHHFRILELSRLYSLQGAEELSNIKSILGIIYNSSGENGLKEFLINGFRSRQKNHLNSWQSAMYAAMSESEWFLNEGFRMS